MTRGWQARHGERRLLAELQHGLRPVARPNLLTVLWRWRYELITVIGLPGAALALLTRLSYLWILAEAAAVAAVLASYPPARALLVAHIRCVVTAHRVRTGCAQAWICSRDGKLPAILLTRPTEAGERVYIWCRAGTCLEDFEASREILRAACWAQDVRATSSTRYSHIVMLDVIRC